MARTILMVAPDHFGYNDETAASNAFQKNTIISSWRDKAMKEFNLMVETLRQNGIEVITFASPKDQNCPDAVFPNNWFSTHHDGKLVIYPMLTINRRAERNPEIIDFIKKKYKISEVIDLHEREQDYQILEGTGSIVFDHESKTAYACISARTDEELLNEICKKLKYQPVVFEAFGQTGEEIYHTNVLLTIGKKFIVVCLECIENPIERNMLKSTLVKSGKKLIEISFSQLMAFAGNMLEVENQEGKNYLVMSTTAHQSLSDQQKKSLSEFAELLPVSIPTIETIGGGSARCMMAEIHFNS